MVIKALYWAAVVLIFATAWGIVRHINFCLKQATGRSGWSSWLSVPMSTDFRERMDQALDGDGWSSYNRRLFWIGLIVRLLWIVTLFYFARWLVPNGFLSTVLSW